MVEKLLKVLYKNPLEQKRGVEMTSEKYPPISAGTLVKTTSSNTPDSEWTSEARTNRKWGVQGKVLTHHDSHGLCYEVKHSDGTVGAYDPSELEVVDNELVILINEFLDRFPGYVGELADNLLVSKPSIRRWAEGRNLPRPKTAESIVKRLKKLLAD